MINENIDKQKSNNIQPGTFTSDTGAETSENIDRLKEIGLKGLTPLLTVVQKHKNELNPYFEAIEKAMQAGVSSLNMTTGSVAEKKVGSWLADGASWVKEIKSKLETTQSRDLITYLENEARGRPGLMFAVSYVAGLAFGRIGRHLIHVNSEKGSSQGNFQSDLDSKIH